MSPRTQLQSVSTWLCLQHYMPRSLEEVTCTCALSKRTTISSEVANNLTLPATQKNQKGFIPGMQWWFNICKLVRWQNKDHMIISTDTDKACDKVKHFFMIKTLSTLDIEGKAYMENTLLTKALPLRSGRQKCPLSLLLVNTVLKILASVIRQEK